MRKRGKRANGEGTVYQRKDGRWAVSLTLDGGKRKTYYFKSQAEAIQAKNRLNVAKDQGTLIISPDPTLRVFLEDWLQNTVHHNVRESTYLRYRSICQNNIIPILGQVKLQKLTPQHIRRLYTKKLEEGYAPGTVQLMHLVLHRALGDALKWDLVTRNVCKAVKAPRVPRREMQSLTAEQAQHFLNVAKGDRFEALYVLALNTGMREGELFGLQWKDIDFDHGTLHVNRTLVRIPRQGYKVSEPKSARSRRSIVLTANALEALHQHRILQHKMRLAAGSCWHDQGWVFCNRKGKPIDIAGLSRYSFFPLLQKAGLPKIRFHDLRHSTATLLLSIGVHPKIVQELLGHSSVAMTLDIYSHVLPSMQQEAIDRLGTLLKAQ